MTLKLVRTQRGKMKLVAYCIGLCEPNPDGTATYGYVIVNKQGRELYAGGREAGSGKGMTTNIVEYLACIRVLEWVSETYPNAELVVKSHSQLLINQLNGSWPINAPYLFDLRKEAKKLERKIAKVQYVRVRENSDTLQSKAEEEAKDVFSRCTPFFMTPWRSRKRSGERDRRSDETTRSEGRGRERGTSRPG
jgi:ribonuclease HI